MKSKMVGRNTNIPCTWATSPYWLKVSLQTKNFCQNACQTDVKGITKASLDGSKHFLFWDLILLKITFQKNCNFQKFILSLFNFYICFAIFIIKSDHNLSYTHYKLTVPLVWIIMPKHASHLHIYGGCQSDMPPTCTIFNAKLSTSSWIYCQQYAAQHRLQ